VRYGVVMPFGVIGHKQASAVLLPCLPLLFCPSCLLPTCDFIGARSGMNDVDHLPRLRAASSDAVALVKNVCDGMQLVRRASKKAALVAFCILASSVMENRLAAWAWAYLFLSGAARQNMKIARNGDRRGDVALAAWPCYLQHLYRAAAEMKNLAAVARAHRHLDGWRAGAGSAFGACLRINSCRIYAPRAKKNNMALFRAAASGACLLAKSDEEG